MILIKVKFLLLNKWWIYSLLEYKKVKVKYYECE